MDNIRIEEYDHSYAKSLADMWNKSGEGWGGNNTEITEEAMRQAHENSVDMNIYLAMEGSEVLGYCSLSEYREDIGALYISLLNVRTDCHGKGIGKMLVKHAVNRCIELDWPRLDLYTWPGNVKAVPLYKRCGFFWEKRDEVTHLMNFIPTVLKTDAVKNYFEKADWYEDSKRVIEIIPDGNTEKGFDFYEYCWEKDGSWLRMEFERRGRGLRLVETDDYMVSLSLETAAPVFGCSYKAVFQIVNKTAEPLEIAIKGMDDKNIKYDYATKMKVSEKATLTSEFFVDEFEEAPSEWKTHPSVMAELMINGRKAFFKVGVIPKLPVQVRLEVPDELCFKGIMSKLYVDIVNNFNEAVEVRFALEDTEKLELAVNAVEARLMAGQRISVPVNYVLKDYCSYRVKPEIECTLEDGRQIKYKRQLHALFKGYNGMLWGEDDDCFFAVNGRNIIRQGKEDNKLIVGSTAKECYETIFFYPRIGKPYSTEFSKLRPSGAEFDSAGDAVIMKVFHDSKDFPGLRMASVSKLYGNGIVEHYYEVANKADKECDKEVWVSENLYYNLCRSVIPYEGKYLETKDYEGGDMDYWNAGKLHENWIFTKSDKITRGVAWSKDKKAYFDSYYLFVEDNLGKFQKGETRKSHSMFVAYDTFGNWKDFRSFATGTLRNEKVNVSNNVDLIINDNNPFVKENFKAVVKEHRQTYLNGRISISSANNCFDQLEMNLEKDSKVKEAEFTVQTCAEKPIDIVKGFVSTDVVELEHKRAVFKVGEKDIKEEELLMEGLKVYSASNGSITIKASPDFAHSLFSMVYNENEWLDTPFPVPEPKHYWNPWVGGMEVRPEKFLPASAIKEAREAGFAELKDNLGNRWKGIRLSMMIREHEKYKGLTINQYFLLLPGCPVMCHTAEFIQNMGCMYNNKQVVNFSFIMADRELRKSWYMLRDETGKSAKYKCGIVGQDIQTYKTVMFGSDAREEKLLVVTDSEDLHHTICSSNKLVTNRFISRLTLESGNRAFIHPVFYVFSKDYIGEEELSDLRRIKFTPEV